MAVISKFSGPKFTPRRIHAWKGLANPAYSLWFFSYLSLFLSLFPVERRARAVTISRRPDKYPGDASAPSKCSVEYKTQNRPRRRTKTPSAFLRRFSSVELRNVLSFDYKLAYFFIAPCFISLFSLPLSPYRKTPNAFFRFKILFIVATTETWLDISFLMLFSEGPPYLFIALELSRRFEHDRIPYRDIRICSILFLLLIIGCFGAGSYVAYHFHLSAEWSFKLFHALEHKARNEKHVDFWSRFRERKQRSSESLTNT